MTKKLFWIQPYDKEFEATITAVRKEGTVLDQTLFYPRSGGQASDRGILKMGDLKLEVDNVSKADDEIIHQIPTEFLDTMNIGDKITGTIDWEYRYGLMKAHTSQHLFSAIVKKMLDIDTGRVDISFEEVTFQLTKSLSYDQLKSAYKEINRICTVENIKIISKIITYKEAVDLSKDIRGEELPKHDTIRLIESENYDLTACGGTHVRNSNEIGLLFIYEFKRGTDIKYNVGMKALTEISEMIPDLLEFSNSINQPITNLNETLKKRSNLIDNLQRDKIDLTINILHKLSENPNLKIENIGISYIDFQVDNKTLSKEFKNFPPNSLLIIKLEEKKYKIFSNSKDILAKEVIQYLIEKYEGKGGGSDTSAQCALDNKPVDILNDMKIFLNQK